MGRGRAVRLFAGLPLPPDVADSLARALAPARARSPGARWVPAENHHVTLRFFGELDDAARAVVSELLDSKELLCPVISCRLGAAGQFPAQGAPRVLWVGLEKGAAEVHALWENLSHMLAPLEKAGGPLQGLPRENRGFIPHITLARAGNASIRPGWVEGVIIPAVDFVIAEWILYQSLLCSEGVRYVPLKRVPLLKGAS